MLKDSNLRPSSADLTFAKKKLAGSKKVWAKRRIKALSRLKRYPQADECEIARRQKTRTKWIEALLNRWKLYGLSGLTSFGRRTDLDANTAEKLIAALADGHLRSLVDVQEQLAKWKGYQCTLATVSKYCRELGAILPRRLPHRSAERSANYHWSHAQVADLKASPSWLRPESNAILLIGAEGCSIRAAASQYEIPATRIRTDLAHFEEGGVAQIIAHRRKADVLVRNGVQRSFVAWCDARLKRTGKPPTAAAAQKFLGAGRKSKGGTTVPLRAVYNHLAKWRTLRHRSARGYVRGKKLVPSGGLEVRSLP